MFSSFKRAWQLRSRYKYHLSFSKTLTGAICWTVNGPPSFNHWAVSAWEDLPDSELDRMVQDQRTDASQRNWSLLLAAAKGKKVKIVKKLLVRGCSPNEEVAFSFKFWQFREGNSSPAMRNSTTMWMAFCIQLVSEFERWWLPSQAGAGLGRFHGRTHKVHFQILELLLEAGANPEVNFKFTAGLPDDPSTWESGADISLRQIVLWASPNNQDRLMELMEGKRASPTSDTAAFEPHGWEYFEGFEIIEQTVTCGNETIEYGGRYSGKPYLELPLW